MLITLREDFAKEYKFLPISLATLQANEEENNISDLGGESDEKEREKRIESLNRKIEYSILQQLIYREKRRQYRIPVLEKLYICLNGNW